MPKGTFIMARKSNSSSESSFTQSTQTTKHKTMQPEQLFKKAFTPKTSKKDGSARLTFAAYKHSVTKDGVRPYFSIIFSCADITGENPANISVLSSYRVSETNVLGRLLKVLGYTASEKIETITDPDDEFGYTVEENLDDIYDFLDSKRGLVFKGILTKGERSLYRIEVDELKPLLGKDGTQLRDYAAAEGLSGNETTIDLQADGGDDK